jgi:hypothetical protein
MKTVTVKRPKLFWADYTFNDGQCSHIELRIYKESMSEYKGKTYYHHRHILSLKYQANAGNTIQAYCLRYEYEQQYAAFDAHRIVGKLLRQPNDSIKQTLRALKKMRIPKFIYSAAPHNSFLPYNWRNNKSTYFRLLA